LGHRTDLVVDVGFSGFDGKPAVGHVFHLRGQLFPRAGKVGKDENDDDPDETCDGTFDNVEPLPRKKTSELFWIQRRRRSCEAWSHSPC
jgi:hypothetical protein